MILIVDDRPENIFSLTSILELHSFPVDTALSGEEALRKTLKNSYSLIILDVQMPGMDGFETAEFLSGNSSTREIPIIFLSAVNTEKKFITRGYSSGAIDYIVKPIDPDVLVLKVKTFHRLYEQNKELIEAKKHLQAEIEMRKKVQQQIQDKAQELNGILSTIPQVAFTATADGTIDFVNSRWYQFSGSLSEFPAVHPDDHCIVEAWKNMIATTTPLEIELRMAKLGTREYRYYLLRVVSVTENNSIVKWVGTFTDIEEQKQITHRKDEFLSIASHELKTPLTSIKAYVQLLEQQVDKDEISQKFIERTLRQVNKLDSLINDLLDVSKIENGKLRFELKEIEFDSLFSSTLEMLSHIYPGMNITFEGNAKGLINGNEVRLEQVIINLVSNAVKYSPRTRGVEIIRKITPANELYFGIKDSGIGISEEDQKNIFSKFYRVTDANRYAQGLGIGLYICAEILKRHNAGFGVISKPGEGSLFYFTIPLVNKS